MRAIKQETIDALVRMVLEDFSHPGVREWWADQGRESFANDFSNWVDGVAGGLS